MAVFIIDLNAGEIKSIVSKWVRDNYPDLTKGMDLDVSHDGQTKGVRVMIKPAQTYGGKD